VDTYVQQAFFSMLWQEFLVVTLERDLLKLLLEISRQQGTGSALHRLSQTFLCFLHGRHISRSALILLFFTRMEGNCTYDCSHFCSS